MALTRPKRRARREQLDLWGGPAGALQGQPDLLPTSVLQRHPSCGRVLDLIRQVRIFFPELDGITIRVGLTRSAAGLASRDDPYIWVNPHRLTRHTIAHEFVHLLQTRGLVPGGEKSADLCALARHPVIVDDLPAYLETPPGLRRAYTAKASGVHRLLHQVARESWQKRADGHRTYLRWFETELAERAQGWFASLPPRETAVQETLF